MVKDKALLGLAGLGAAGAIIFINRDRIFSPTDDGEQPPDETQPEPEPQENIIDFQIQPKSGTSPLTVFGQITFRDSRSDIVWIWGDGKRSFGITNPSHEYFSGTYNGRVEVIDSDDNKEVKTFTVTVAKTPEPTPNDGGGGDDVIGEITDLTVSPDSGFAPLTVNASVTGTRRISSVVWDWGEGSPSLGGTSDTHVYSDPGTYNGVVNVTFDNGDTDSRVFTVSVGTANQVEVTGIRVFQDTIEPNDLVFFELLTEGGLVGNVSVRWNWGDGTFKEGVLQESHQYSDFGTYTVTATLKLDGETIGSASTTIQVESEQLPGNESLQPGDVEARNILVTRVVQPSTFQAGRVDFQVTIRKNVPGTFDVVLDLELFAEDGSLADFDGAIVTLGKTDIDRHFNFSLQTLSRGNHVIELTVRRPDGFELDSLRKTQFI